MWDAHAQLLMLAPKPLKKSQTEALIEPEKQ